MFDFIRNQMQQQRRRKALTARLRRFTAASGTSPKMQPAQPAKAVYGFAYDPYTTTRGAL